MKVLRILSLPFILIAGAFLGVIGMAVYWYHWSFKKENLYKKYGANN